jgi:stage II sporulation protein D
MFFVSSVAWCSVPSVAQRGVTDADLVTASGGRTLRIGSPSTGGLAIMPLELYVARVLAGEGEPRAAAAAQQALAVAIRTYAIANIGRHRREGFDLCDSTHCQVLRAATTATREAVSSTAGRILTYNGRPAELFYSASCGGRTESAAAMWPRADYPYLTTTDDDVHLEDEPWTLERPLASLQVALQRAGFSGGRLHAVEVGERSASGRVTRLYLRGLHPDVITGDRFRAAVGVGELRSTAFVLAMQGDVARFTGRGYGHGVGLCVIGAGRRAQRGETMEAILGKYFPGLVLTGGGQAATSTLRSRPGA